MKTQLFIVSCNLKNAMPHHTFSMLQHIQAIEESVWLGVFLPLFFFPLPFASLYWYLTATDVCLIVQAVIHHKTLWTKRWAAFRRWIGADRRKHPAQEVNQGAVLSGGVTVCVRVSVAVEEVWLMLLMLLKVLHSKTDISTSTKVLLQDRCQNTLIDEILTWPTSLRAASLNHGALHATLLDLKTVPPRHKAS